MASKETAKKAEKKTNDYLHEPVTVMLVKDDLRYTDDVTVTYNGTNYQIKRGVPVEVPRVIKMILDDSFRQQAAATDFSKGLEENFFHKTDRMARGLKIN